ncbi:hypothetical protein IAD21_02222 [Abditibacteriota bacterium]|nr:hypothetical protein IAD21_02222 [Abditibacteriota bacterium]
MATALKAHFDGEKILLDEPFDLPMRATLLVTVLTSDEWERDELTEIAKRSLARAYGNTEPGYSLYDLL